MSNENSRLKKWQIGLICSWPGLARLWFRGDFGGLAMAGGFSWLINLALVSTFLWTKWPTAGFPWVIWPAVALIWLGLAALTFFRLDQIVQRPLEGAESGDTLLIRAQREYLRGNWSEVQALLLERLRFRPRDIPARLLLATMYRRARRFDKTVQQLDTLQRFDESGAWWFEIARERDLTVGDLTSGAESEFPAPETGQPSSDRGAQTVKNIEEEKSLQRSFDNKNDDKNDDQSDPPRREAA